MENACKLVQHGVSVVGKAPQYCQGMRGIHTAHRLC